MSLKKNQHELFRQFFEKPTRAFLSQVLKENIGETDYLDFKAEWPRLEHVAKHMLAMGNSGGGAIVFGVTEEQSGEFDSKGLEKLQDRADLNKKFRKFVPEQLNYELFNFSYDKTEPSLEGKNFQVIMIEYSEKILPLLALKEGPGIQSNVAYVRSGTESIPANREQLEQLINARIDTEYSSTPTLELTHHLEQLKTLCEHVDKLEYEELLDSGSFMREILEFAGDDDYRDFLNEIISSKKQVIRKIIH
ncbi:AlbA family DNA-binding domain-containing protein [Vreelandella sp. V005]|uniref:AlbA family DNA-binding domain-containing protein n=1 Tax=Vreelandella sp. V005 TaxID=3459608 RepID=UPI004044677B